MTPTKFLLLFVLTAFAGFLVAVVIGQRIVFLPIVMRLDSDNSLVVINTLKKIPDGFKRISVEKKKPPEGDWLLATAYENSRRQRIIFHYEPRRNIRCTEEDMWKKDLATFRPTGSSLGCSFTLENFRNGKITTLHWFLWNINDVTYSIYDEESVLSDQEAMSMAESVGPEIGIAKDLIKKK